MQSTFETTSRFYSFGPFCLDAARLLLYKDGKCVALAPRFVRTLLLLVQNQGLDLDKTYLMDKLWPDTAVEENNLTVIISALRKVFGDDPGQNIARFGKEQSRRDGRSAGARAKPGA